LDCGPYSDIYFKLGLNISNKRYIVNSRATQYELLQITDGYVLDSRKMFVGDSYNAPKNYDWRFLPLKDCPVRSEIGFLVRENTTLTTEIKCFINMVKDYLLRDIYPESI